MTTGWDVFKRFPVWFYNMPPTDRNPPDADDRPPYVTLKMTVLGYLDAKEPGSLDLQIGRYMTTAMFVDGRPAEPNGEGAYRIDVGPGLHLIQIDNTLQGNQWRFMPSWNQAAMGTSGFPLATTERPASRDRGWLRTLIGWLTTGLSAIFVIAWFVSALRAWGDITTLAWAAAASIWLAFLAPRPGNEYVTSDVARWSVTALGFAALLPIGSPASASPLRGYGATSTLRGAFVVIGIPWLVFVGVGAFDHLAKFSFYAGGDDQWTFQRAAYRIYLQGYWLEGGEPTFWFQPGYRWIAGALHMLFGDSSLGEFHWDGICLAVMALFAHEVVARTAGFKWGLVAAATVLTLVIQGPPWIYWGVGLSEHAAAGFIYAAALTAMLRHELAAAAGRRRAGDTRFLRASQQPADRLCDRGIRNPARRAGPRSLDAAAMAGTRRLAHRRLGDWGRCDRHAALLVADVVLHWRLLIFPGHDAWHQCHLSTGHAHGRARAPHGRQRVDGAVDERSAALRLVRHADGHRGGDLGGRAYRRAGGAQPAARVGVVLLRGVVGSARRTRCGVYRPLFNHPDRHGMRGDDWRRGAPHECYNGWCPSTTRAAAKGDRGIRCDKMRRCHS